MTSILTPFNNSAPIDLGRLWRKQVLKLGKVNANGAELDITPDLCRDLAQSFNEHAYDQVPLQLVDADNKHNEHPENYRGEVKAFEVTPDGLDMIMEPSPKGAELLRENPKLGVSARIIPNYERSDGKKWRAAIRHIAGTLDPVVTQMRPWQAVNLSSTDTGEVIDLSTEEYEMPDDSTDTKPEDKTAEVVEEQKPKTVDELLAQLSDEDLQALASEELTPEEVALLNAADTDEEDPAVAETQELVGADLSAEAQAAIDLANKTAKEAQDRTAALELQLANERADREADAYKAAGVPPADVDLARPALARPGQVIDLSNGEKTDSVAIIRGLLNSRKGTIDLSKEHGHGDMTVEARKQHDDLMAAWDKDFPQLKK